MKPCFIIFICLLALVTHPVTGFSNESEQARQILDEMVVTAGRVSETRKDLSSDVTIIRSTEIQQSNAVNVADLLAEKGVGYLKKYPGTLTSVGIRGLRTDTHGNDLQGRVLVLLDGRRTGTGNLAKMLTHNLERIEIIRGPGAVQYGSAGMGGVINLITRQADTNGLQLSTGMGSFGLARGAVSGTARKNGVDFSGAVFRETRGDYKTGAGQRYHNTGVDAESGISANLGYSWDVHHRVGVIFTGFDAKGAGSPGYVSTMDLDDTGDKKSHSIDLNYSGDSRDGGWQWMARFFSGRDKDTRYEPVASNPDGWDDGVPSVRETRIRGGQAQLTRFAGDTRLTAGLDWVDYDIESDYSPFQSQYVNPALFLLARTGFMDDRLVVNLGVRHDWYEVDMQDPAGRSESTRRLTPSLGLSYMVTPVLKFRAQYAQGFMMPTADQMGSEHTGWSGPVRGNPDLDPEKSATYEAGMDFFKNGFTASVTGFYTDYEDMIVTTVLPDGTGSWKNEGESVIAGFQADLRYDIGALFHWSWEVSPYLGITALTRYEDKLTGKDLLDVSGRDYLAGILLDSGQGTFLRFNTVYTGSQLVRDWQAGMFSAPEVRKSSFLVASLTGAWRFHENERTGRFSVRGEVHNLFDEEYAYVKGYPMPGRSFFAGIEWDF